MGEEISSGRGAHADYIRARRAKLGMTQEQLAECMGITAGSLARVETGHKVFGDDTTKSLAKCLRLNAADKARLMALRLERVDELARNGGGNKPAPTPTELQAEVTHLRAEQAAMVERLARLERLLGGDES